MVNHKDFKLNHVIIIGNDSYEDARSALLEQLAKGRKNKKIGFPSSVLVFPDNARFQNFLDNVRTGWLAAGSPVWAAGPPKLGVFQVAGTYDMTVASSNGDVEWDSDGNAVIDWSGSGNPEKGKKWHVDMLVGEMQAVDWSGPDLPKFDLMFQTQEVKTVKVACDATGKPIHFDGY